MSQPTATPQPAWHPVTAYAPRQRWHASVTALCALTLIALTIATTHPIRLAMLLGIAALWMAALRWSWRQWGLMGVAGATLALIARHIWPDGTFAFISIVRLCIIAQAITLLGATTDIAALMQVIPARIPVLRGFSYVCATTLTILPSVQRDLRRSLDIIWLRRGIRFWPLGIAAWGDVITDTLIRTIVRGDRLGQTVTDRRFRLERGLTSLPHHRPHWYDGLAWVVVIAAAIGFTQLPW